MRCRVKAQWQWPALLAVHVPGVPAGPPACFGQVKVHAAHRRVATNRLTSAAAEVAVQTLLQYLWCGLHTLILARQQGCVTGHHKSWRTEPTLQDHAESHTKAPKAGDNHRCQSWHGRIVSAVVDCKQCGDRKAGTPQGCVMVGGQQTC